MLARRGRGEDRVGETAQQALGQFGLEDARSGNIGGIDVELDAKRRGARQQRIGEGREEGREIGALAGAGTGRLELGDEIEILGGFEQ